MKKCPTCYTEEYSENVIYCQYCGDKLEIKGKKMVNCGTCGGLIDEGEECKNCKRNKKKEKNTLKKPKKKNGGDKWLERAQEIDEIINVAAFRPSIWPILLGVVIILVFVTIPVGYVIWAEFFQENSSSRVVSVEEQEEPTPPEDEEQESQEEEPRPSWPDPPDNLILESPSYQGSVENIFRQGRRVWWQGEYFSCTVAFGPNTAPAFSYGQEITRGDWTGWRYAELGGEGDRYLFLSVCGAGWNTYISEVPAGSDSHLGQAVVQDGEGRRAYLITSSP